MTSLASAAVMTSLTILALGQEVKERLRIRAARHGRSMEEEAREILRAAIAQKQDAPTRLAGCVRRRFAPFGGVELELPRRDCAHQ